MKKKLLVVDDDPDLRKTIRLILQKNYTILEAGDGPGALRVMSKENPAVVLLDMSMPDMDGLAVLKRLPPCTAKTIVIVLTGEKDVDVAQKALTMGATEYITKPFDSEYLRKEITRLVCTEPGKCAAEQPPWRMVR